MKFLADSCYHVVGIEHSSIAIKAYFDASEVNPSRQRVGSFTRWQHGETEIWGGDIFDLTTKDINQNSPLYDCASLTAFPAEQRPEYTRHFYERMSEQSQIVLVTTETADQAVADSENPHVPPASMGEKIYHMKNR